MTFAPTVSVCVCTHRRPELLSALLASLVAQTYMPDRFEIVVVDNDGAGSGKPSVDAARQKWPSLAIRYEVEPRSGISYARNRAVALARGRYLAFIDDDEVADKAWLEELLAALASSGADAVIGPVLPLFPPASPEWVKRSGFFDRPRFEHLKRLGEEDGRTSNAIVFADQARRRGGEVFLPRFAHSGGEDFDFFKWYVRQGGVLVWSDRAIVSEFIPDSRQRLSFMLERSFRTAVTYWAAKFSERDFSWILMKTLFGVVGGVAYLLLGVLSLTRGLSKAAPYWCKGCRALGRLGAVMRLNLTHYGR